TDVKKTERPYGVTVFENSPLNRVLQQGAPGKSWQPSPDRGAVLVSSDSGHTVVTEYGTNAANSVRLWTVSSPNGATGSGYYGAGKLYKTVLKDENWVAADNKAGTVEEYKDFDDRVVLKRVWESDSKSLDTYYAYDDFGDLRYVIPPGFTATTITDTHVDVQELVYIYKYDGRRRLVEKKLPGKGWEWLVYNANDQVVLTQDAVQRSKTAKEWSYTKYDAFGRVTETGIYPNSTLSTRALAQSAVDNHKVAGVAYYWEEWTGSTYSNRTYPIESSRKVQVTNYYDSYSFNPGSTLAASAGLGHITEAKTLLTGTKVTNVDDTDSRITVNYYDKRGRLLETVAQNHLGGIDRVTNSYNFAGDLLTSKQQ
ncbi:DUF6443 domain-containing protein, partial [Sphingobacterium hotanense]|uniref:DUF6443 domain-containing protein n=1 Tax=Sphingobacterium hotanense TaxID=649196 RepID=UPI0021A2B74F